MLFAKQAPLRRHFPMTRVDYIRVPGRDWVPDPENRYQALEIIGPLLTTIPRIVATILDDIPKAFLLPKDEIHRRDVPLIPQTVIREAVVNALMHRSYRIRQPVQIIRYANRIEIRNPGHSLVPDDRLGEPGSISRNEKIAAVLHEVGLAETKGTGIRAMRQAMEKANLTQPLFESDRHRDAFTVTLLVHHLLGPDDLAWLGQFRECKLTEDEARAMIVVREVGAINNAFYRSINHLDTLTASGHLRRLRELGLLDQKGKGAATYYIPGPKVLAKGATSRTRPTPLRPEFEALRPEFEALRPELPQDLAADFDRLGKRATTGELSALLIKLCLWRPLSLPELAALTGKTPDHLRRRNLRRLLADGRIRYLYPEEPNHPHQKYTAGKEAP
jgi:ATP-dependent DNA helicase RecG